MKNKPTIKEIYENTIPDKEKVDTFYQNTVTHYNNPDAFFDLSNTAFCFLAHLRVTDFSNYKKYYKEPFYLSLLSGCKNIKIISKSNTLNPSAVPIIKKYITAFENYEKNNGITNPYVKKLGKEPGDN